MSTSTACDDGAIIKQVQAIHAPHGREVVLHPVINVTEQILIQAIGRSTGHVHAKGERPETSKKASHLAELNIHDTLIIQKISHELSSCKWSGGGALAHAHTKTMELLNTLSSYPWHAKVVLVLSGFAINFGEFWYFVQPCPVNTLSKSLALLRKLPNIGDKSSPLKRQFDRLNTLVKAALEVTKCLAEVMNLPFYYISEDAPAMSVASALIPNAVYWTIKCIVTCSSQIASVLSLRNEYISPKTEAWELSTLTSKVNNIHEQLKNQLDMCYQYIEQKIIHQSLTYSDEDLQTDVNGSNETRVNMGIQRRKHMLLLISNLNISEEEIQILDNLYKDQAMRSERFYEMVWVPVVDKQSWNYSNQCKFKELKSMMPWYNFHHPVIDPALIKKIKEEWNFSEKPIVLVRDPQGRVSCTNAIHMMRIWGNLAFPFTREREEELWNGQIWSLETIIDPVNAGILEWMTEGKHLCLYGGGNLEWIRTFTKTMTSVAIAANITLEKVYVGKSNGKKQVQTMITTLAEEKLSNLFTNYEPIWFFWARLESMLYSKLQHNKTVENDQFMSELTTLLNYDRVNEEWAIFFGGAFEIVRDSGTKILTALNEFENWKANVEPEGFEPALKEYLEKNGTPLHCTRMILPGETGELLKGTQIICAECGRFMDKYVIYRCEQAID